jgi:UDPglucose 6-dehydrogenase
MSLAIRKVAFIGLGKLGLPCAEKMADRYDVIGFDLLPRKPRNFPVAPTLGNCVAERDVIFVAVPTPHHRSYDGSSPIAHLPVKDFDYTTVRTILEELNTHLNKDQLVVLISTVLPGTTRRLFAPLIRRYRFVYNPYFIAMGTTEWDMVNPEMVLLGTESGEMTTDAQRIIEFYRPLMENNPRYIVGTWDEAEAVKVFYNTFISAKISMVNMIQDVAERNGNINVDVVTEALAGSKMRITGPKYMRAGMGDAGSCHPRDNIALRYLAQRLDLGYDLFDAIVTSREVQARRMAEHLVMHARRVNLPIIIHGKAYKPGLAYVDGSYSVLVGHYCAELGHSPYYIDPIVPDRLPPELGSPAKGVFLMAHNANISFDYANTLKERSLYCEIAPGSVVVDPWREFQPMKGVEVIHYGNTRTRVPAAEVNSESRSRR